MTIIEYQPSTVRGRSEHRRMIREMGRGVMYPNPIILALCEIGAAILGGAVWAGLCWAIASWILTA